MIAIHGYWCETCGPTTCPTLTARCITCDGSTASYYTAEMEEERRLRIGAKAALTPEAMTRVLREAADALEAAQGRIAIAQLHLAGLDSRGAAVRVLRALQRFDAVAATEHVAKHGDVRLHLIQALDELGVLLGLECTGEPEGGGYYDHAGDTCPIHEWLVPADAEDVGAELRAATE